MLVSHLRCCWGESSYSRIGGLLLFKSSIIMCWIFEAPTSWTSSRYSTATLWGSIHIIHTLQLSQIYIASNDLWVTLSFRKNEYCIPWGVFITSIFPLLPQIDAQFICVSKSSAASLYDFFKIKFIDCDGASLYGFLKHFFFRFSHSNCVWFLIIQGVCSCNIPFYIYSS